MNLYDHVYKGRKVKFYRPCPRDIPLDTADSEKEKLENGIMHEWFMCGTNVYMPYALIERKDGTMVLVNYHDVIFEPIPESIDTSDLFIKGTLEGEQAPYDT